MYLFIHMHSHQCLEQFITPVCMLINVPCANCIFHFSLFPAVHKPYSVQAEEAMKWPNAVAETVKWTREASCYRAEQYITCYSLLTYIIWFSWTHSYWTRNTDAMSLLVCTCGSCNRTQVRWVHPYKAILETTSAYTDLQSLL